MKTIAVTNQMWVPQAAKASVAGRAGITAAIAAHVARQRRETLWAWLSVLVLLICWDAATRLDQKVSPPRPRLTHVAEAAEERFAQNALIPVSARPTVN